MSTTTTNYGLIKPDTTDPILIGQLNDNSDAIDAALKENADAIENKPDAADIPTPSTAAPAMDGTAAAGTSTDYARADHIHPSDTSKQDALSAAQLAAVNSGINSAKVEQIETNKNNISLVEEVNGGWNLLNNVATSQTVSPFVITVNSDKSVLVQTTGTIPSNSFFEIGYVTLSAGTYVLSGGYSDACRVQDWDGTYKSGANPTTFTLSATTTLRICIRVSTAFSSAEGVLIKPMIVTKALYDKGAINYVPYALSNVELTAAIQALQAQLANQ